MSKPVIVYGASGTLVWVRRHDEYGS